MRARLRRVLAAVLLGNSLCDAAAAAAALAQVPFHSESEQKDCSLFGHELANVGDQDGDGRDDLAVAAPLGWSEHGRNGRVLILSTTSGEVLRDYAGLPNDWEFGMSVWPIAIADHHATTHLAVSTFRRDIGGTYWPGKSWEVRPVTRVISLETGLDVAELDWVDRVLGSPGDFDGDGIRDYLCYVDKGDGDYTWYSGRDWRALKTPAFRSQVSLLNEDYDGDGLADVIAYSHSDPRTISVCSSKTGDRIKLLGSTTTIPNAARAAVNLSLRLDGKRSIVVCAKDNDSRDPVHRVFSGITGKQSFVGPCRCQAMWGGVFYRALFALPDLDADGFDDFCEVNTEFPFESVHAYSGRTMAPIWTAKGVVSSHTLTLTTTRIAEVSTQNERGLIAVGNVFDMHTGQPHGDMASGEVVLLDARTGVAVRRYLEKDYPDISYAAYRERTREKKK